MQMAATVGINRHIESLIRGIYRNPYGADSGLGVWDSDIEAAGAEIAVAKSLAIYWGGGINTFKDADVGYRYQVRHTVVLLTNSCISLSRMLCFLSKIRTGVKKWIAEQYLKLFLCYLSYLLCLEQLVGLLAQRCDILSCGYSNRNKCKYYSWRLDNVGFLGGIAMKLGLKTYWSTYGRYSLTLWFLPLWFSGYSIGLHLLRIMPHNILRLAFGNNSILIWSTM